MASKLSMADDRDAALFIRLW